MSTLVTGGNGYIGSAVVERLARHERLILMVRADGREAAIQRLWHGMQVHTDAARFAELLDRVDFVQGDLHAPGLGLSDDHLAKILRDATSVLHIAASLNRKSAKSCLNTNLRGTLAMAKLARVLADRKRLRRFSYISTVAVAGQRHHELITEDAAIEWDRSDYDPYGRTKKFCEHMLRELLPEVDTVVFRPSIVLGDSRHPRTTSFEMVRAFAFFADLPLIPIAASSRVDIVNTDWVAHAIATLHHKPQTDHGTYHLSSGADSPTGEQIRQVLGGRFRFAPGLERSFGRVVRLADTVARSRSVPGAVRKARGFTGAIEVFWPYVRYDTVFDNTRAVQELGVAPVSFREFGPPLLEWARGQGFRYPYVERG